MPKRGHTDYCNANARRIKAKRRKLEEMQLLDAGWSQGAVGILVRAGGGMCRHN